MGGNVNIIIERMPRDGETQNVEFDGWDQDWHPVDDDLFMILGRIPMHFLDEDDLIRRPNSLSVFRDAIAKRGALNDRTADLLRILEENPDHGIVFAF